METNKKLLIGGQALRTLGSTRFTADTDYLVNLETSKEAFLFDRENNTDYCNANGLQFFAEVWKMERKNETGVASADALAELKAFSFVQDCLNRQWKKADNAEFDLKFLKSIGAKMPVIVKKYVTAGQFSEIEKLWK